MKVIFYILLFIFFNLTATAQPDTLISYFDSEWEKTDEINAIFYRKAYPNETGNWTATDYYLSGAVQMTGYFRSKRCKYHSGHFTFYHENGNKACEGDFIKDKMEGNWKYWREDGSIICDLSIEKDRFHGISHYYSKHGVIARTVTCEKGKIVGLNVWAEESNELSDKLEIEPQFIGGTEALQAYILDETKYPEKAKKDSITGTVRVRFIVEADGSISNVSVIQSIHRTLDNEALRIIKNMPMWDPGKINDEPVRVNYTLPIDFRLQ